MEQNEYYPTEPIGYVPSCQQCGDSLTAEEMEDGHATAIRGEGEQFWCFRCLPKHLCVVCQKPTRDTEKDEFGRNAHDDCQVECSRCERLAAHSQDDAPGDFKCAECAGRRSA